MKNGIYSKIMMLGAVLVLAGCGTIPAQPAATVSADDAILSAEELQSMIQVTVTQTVAARD